MKGFVRMLAPVMNRLMERMSIRLRLFIAFTSILTLMLIVSAVALARFNTLTKAIDVFTTQHTRVATLAQKANQHTQSAAINLLRLLQTTDRAGRVPLYANMDKALSDANQAVTELEKSGIVSEADEEAMGLLHLRHEFETSFAETVDLIEIEGLVKAREHFDEKTDPLLRALMNSTLTVAEHRQTQMQTEARRLEIDAADAKNVILSLGLAALLVGGWLAIRIAESVARPVQDAVTVAGAVAGGKYDCSVPMGQGPEMGALMNALKVMRESIASRERRVMDLAYVDTLTNLPNRTKFMEVVTDTVSTANGAILLLDINRFAPINNALGYNVGDRVLQEVAHRLKVRCAAIGLVARLGADEFGLLIKAADEAAARGHAMEILEQLRIPMLLDAERLDIDASMGIVMFPANGTSVTLLMRRAETALALAKRRHDGYAFGSEAADEPQHEQLALIGEMRDALENGEFVAFFQPKLELTSGRIVGAEALLRWRHPEKGLIPPGLFIPFAEQTGFIREVTPRLLAQVIEQVAQWHRRGMSIVTSVNISALDLTGRRLVVETARLLAEHKLPPQLICMEITESALMDDPEVALRHLEELAALGVKLSIDDYGSGQASLGYVQRLPVHELKIDRAFVDQVNVRAKSAAIIRSTILLCHELGLSVVAEGVETADELEWLNTNDCDLVQGYHVAKPMPADAFQTWVEARKVDA